MSHSTESRHEIHDEEKPDIAAFHAKTMTRWIREMDLDPERHSAQTYITLWGKFPASEVRRFMENIERDLKNLEDGIHPYVAEQRQINGHDHP
jgi:hypothetical protein